MTINLKMWRTALSTLVKMEDKQEWIQLDFLSKWLIATRSAVTTVTIYSCIIAAILAFRDNYFSFFPWLIVTIGLFVAHGTNNLLNDYTDFSRGIDADDYFRTQYGVHPLVQNFWTKKQQLTWFFVSGVIACLCGVYALFYTDFSPVIIGSFAIGAIILLIYTWPLKHFALGELSIFLIWGPIMVSAVYLVLSRGVLDNIWQVALAGVPFGLSVVSINLGKHIDKSIEDRRKHVHTLPVLIGEKPARFLNMAILVLIYLTVFYLVFITHYFSPVMLIILFAGKRWLYAFGALFKQRPVEPPKEWPGWPTWFSGFAFYHNRLFENLFLLGLFLDCVLRYFHIWPLS